MSTTFDRTELCARLHDAVAAVPSIDVAYLFGSRARGNARGDSDIDLAIHYAQFADADERERCLQALLAALAAALGPLADRLDVVDIGRASSTLAFRVIRDGHRVFERGARVRVGLEARIARRYDDEEPHRRLFREAAARVGREMERRANGRS